MILVNLWTKTDFGVIFKIIQIYQRYDGANKMQIEQHWVIDLSETVSYSSKEIGNNKNYEETTELEKWHSRRFCLNIDIRKEDGRLKAEFMP